MADISTQLAKIASSADGETVRSAIVSAMSELRKTVNISSELDTIANGIYGVDIRTAIHNALAKLSADGGESEESIRGVGDLRLRMIAHTDANIIVTPTSIDVYPGDPVHGETFGCGALYFKPQEVTTCTIGGRSYSTTIAADRIALIAKMASQNYTFPVFISPNAEAVKYSYNTSPKGSVEYDGITWYYSNTNYAMGGDLVDSTGRVTKYPYGVSMDQDGILQILQKVQAFAVT